MPVPVWAQVSPPSISSVSPVSGAVGDTITITGKNFVATTAENIVYIGNIKAQVISAGSTVLKAKIPAGIGSDPVSVTCNNLTAWSEVRVTLTFPVNNEKFRPSSFGTKIELKGNSIAALADINNDGKLDLLYRDNYGLALVRNTSTVGNISFADPEVYKMDALNSIAAADLDGDGKTDVASVSYPGNHIVIFRNTGNGLSDTIQVPLTVESQFFSLVISDVDNTGKADLFLCSSILKEVYRFKNNSTPGHMSFQLWSIYNNDIAIIPYNLAFADYDGDGKKDMAMCGYGEYLQVFKNVEYFGYWFRNPLNIDLTDRGPVVSDLNVVSVDIDQDGKADLLTSNGGSNSVSVFLNRPAYGDMAFAPPLYFKTDETLDWLSVNDLDGDGKKDLVTNNYSGSSMSVFKNISDSNNVQFAAPVKYQVATIFDGYNYMNLTGDLDGDGKPEMMACQTGDLIVIFKNEIKPNTNVHVCVGTDTALTSPLSGNIYQWQIDTGQGFIPVTDDSIYTGSNSARLTIRNVQSSYQNYLYRCLVDNKNEQVFTLKIDTVTIPDIKISIDMNNICVGTPVEFSATYKDAGNAPSFRWLINGLPTDSIGLKYYSSTLENGDSVSAVVYSNAICSQHMNDTSNIIIMNVHLVTLPVINITAKDSVLVNEPFVITADTSNIRPGSSLTVFQSINGSAYSPYRYVYDIDTASLTFTVSNADSVAGVKKYFIRLYGYSIDGCTLMAVSDTISVIVSKRTPERASSPDEPSGRLYPNPVTDNLTVNDLDLNDGWVTMEIRSMDGAQNLGVYNIEGKTSLNINIATLNKGFYVAVLKRKTGAPKTIRFIKL
ncbi:Por secretion system C-terminal sorting domain-containing protein [Chitinophaga sp. CF118]|uniref:FG-GAP-like repeat-containing protein n=1 Tax=Chitinophaga sp. CF118 TaxID=1884367 RepID=UPI0008E5F26D|nr:FG-GAP-like repeat-containing protein [Chitinophaga sp. CF118]SFE61453.1 Por secretion system C-terminal sorting domain-containing protein [Chitinophaga sp. CF118]